MGTEEHRACWTAQESMRQEGQLQRNLQKRAGGCSTGTHLTIPLTRLWGPESIKGDPEETHDSHFSKLATDQNRSSGLCSHANEAQMKCK